MDLERELNPEQLDAVMHPGGPLLILAGAGSGKTRAITYRIAHLVHDMGVEPWKILALTFTNKAAGEMCERIDKLVGEASGLWALTFHSFGARLLRRHADLLGWGKDFTIYDDRDSKRLGKLILEKLDLDRQLYKVDRMLAAVERAKRKLRGPRQSGLKGPQRDFYILYQRSLKAANAFDFSDLIMQANFLFDRHPEVLEKYRRRFEHVLVDEFQDTDRAQYTLLRMLCPPGANLCVVGDDDQSIYRWRGAEIGNIMGFASDYPGCKTVKLERNYRSTAHILQAAGLLIHKNSRRHPKALWTEMEPGPPVEKFQARDEREEAGLVARGILKIVQQYGFSLGQVAVLYRVNAQSRALEEGMRLFGIPYRVVGGLRFFDRAEVRDVVSYLRLIQNYKSDVDLMRIMNVPPRGLGQKSRQRIVALAEEHGCSMFEVMTPQNLSGFRKKEREAVLQLRRLLEQLGQEASASSASDAVEAVIKTTGYGRWLESMGTMESEGRLENIKELITAAQDMARGTGDESLEGFLEQVALLTDMDLAQEGQGMVTLMTLHASKGLEFDVVFITGMEEGLLPHSRSLDDDERQMLKSPGRAFPRAVEEERRLCYVGMTRARQVLTLTYTKSRSMAGQVAINPPSRFLKDIFQDMGKTSKAPLAEVVDIGGFDLDDDDEIFHGDMLHASDEETVDYSDEYSQLAGDDGLDDLVGRTVVHQAFGKGLVSGARMSPHGPMLTVVFNSVGTKTVMLDYVKMK